MNEEWTKCKHAELRFEPGLGQAELVLTMQKFHKTVVNKDSNIYPQNRSQSCHRHFQLKEHYSCI